MSIDLIMLEHLISLLTHEPSHFVGVLSHFVLLLANYNTEVDHITDPQDLSKNLMSLSSHVRASDLVYLNDMNAGQPQMICTTLTRTSDKTI